MFRPNGSLCLGLSLKDDRVAWATSKRYCRVLLRSSKFFIILSTAFSPEWPFSKVLQPVVDISKFTSVLVCSCVGGFLVWRLFLTIFTFSLSLFLTSVISTSTNYPHSTSNLWRETVECWSTVIPKTDSTSCIFSVASLISATFLISLKSNNTIFPFWFS